MFFYFEKRFEAVGSEIELLVLGICTFSNPHVLIWKLASKTNGRFSEDAKR